MPKELTVKNGEATAEIERLPCAIGVPQGKEQVVDIERFRKTFRKDGENDTAIFHGRPLIAHHYDDNLILAEQEG